MEPTAESLSGYDVVSFDVYDTLVVRPYVRPIDLFAHLERLHSCPDFADQRVIAERTARRNKGREITLDEIYEEMDRRFLYLKDIEKGMEISVPVANERMLALFNELIKSGKKVIIISDMYLSKDVISSMLEHCGYRGYHELYVSSEYKVSKHTGELFTKVLDDLGIKAGQMAHIGDNPRSDHDIPRRLGIATIRYDKPIDTYRRENKNEYSFYKKRPSLERSILIGMDLITRMNGENEIWYDMGYRFGGPLATSYSLKIMSEVGSGTVLFASRDGYNLKRIADEVFHSERTGYIYAQRLIMDVLTDIAVPFGKIDVPDSRKDRYRYAKSTAALKRILRFFSDDLGITVPNDRAEIVKTYFDNLDRLDTLRKERFIEYRNSISGICGDDDIHLVDCTTMKFSSQRLIEYTLGRKVKGHYFVTLGADDTYDHDSMCEWHSPMIGWMNVDIPEFYLSSPEYPLTGWNNGPVFGNENEHEEFRSSIYQDVSDGELQYARQYIDIFGEYAIPLDYWSIVGWSKLSAVRGTKYYDTLSKIKWASDPDHTEYAPLITGAGSIKGIMKKAIISIIDKMNKDNN